MVPRGPRDRSDEESISYAFTATAIPRNWFDRADSFGKTIGPHQKRWNVNAEEVKLDTGHEISVDIIATHMAYHFLNNISRRWD